MSLEPPVITGATRRKTVAYTMKMDPQVKAAAEQAAAADRRSLAALIEVLLIGHCEDRGFLKPEGSRRKVRACA
jgi:hypothetical protein